MPTLSSLVASQVVKTTTCDATSDDKVGIMTTLAFQRWSRDQFRPGPKLGRDFFPRNDGGDAGHAVETKQMPLTDHSRLVNTSEPQQNGRHIADDIFNLISEMKSVCFLIKILLKFVPNDPK